MVYTRRANLRKMGHVGGSRTGGIRSSRETNRRQTDTTVPAIGGARRAGVQRATRGDRRPVTDRLAHAGREAVSPDRRPVVGRSFADRVERGDMDAIVAVVAVESVGPDTVAIELESPDGFEANPGQFVKLSDSLDGEEVSRFYTLSSPDVAETFEVTVGVDPDESGSFSEHLADLEPGDEIRVSGPFGNQFYEGESRVVVLAGGPGVGPAVAVGERARQSEATVAVVYRDDDPAHTERLDALRADGATVVVTDGDVAEAVAEVTTGGDDEQVFVYGFAAFVDEATDALERAGVDASTAKIENFG
jgi:cytochrome-b5 reductase